MLGEGPGVWKNGVISYAIGLKEGCIDGCNATITVPDDGWVKVLGKTDDLKQIYNEIYKHGALKFEIETFYDDGSCEILYYREKTDL